MFFLLLMILMLPLNGDILRVTIPYETQRLGVDSIEEEMILPPSILLGKPSHLAPLFGSVRHGEVFLNDIPLNDPSNPSGMADLQYIDFGQADVEEGNIFNLSSSKILAKQKFSTLGSQTKILLPVKFSPFLSNISQIYPNGESRNSFNAGLKGHFWMQKHTKVDISILKIQGKTDYYYADQLYTSTTHQKGASIRLTTYGRMFLHIRHMDITRKYGSLEIVGQTDSVETGYAFSKNGQLGLKVLREASSADQERTLPSLFWKNGAMSFSLAGGEHDLYPEGSVYLGNKKLFFQGIFKRRPPALGEIKTAFRDEIISSANLSPETLFGVRAGVFQDMMVLEGGSDLIISPILRHYPDYSNFNGLTWGKPFIKFGLQTPEFSLLYKFTSPAFTTQTTQMINTPVHQWSWKWKLDFPSWEVTSNVDVLTHVKRVDMNDKIKNDGYEGRVGVKIAFKAQLSPFVELNVIKTDPSWRNDQLSVIWAGIQIHAL
jgi:hypothetical protein